MGKSRESLAAMTLPAILRERAADTPDAPCFWCGANRLTFAELDAASDRVAAGLAGAGVAPGDRVAVLASNRVELVELWFGCAKAGAIDVPLNSFLKGAFLLHQLRDSGSTTIVVDAPGLNVVAEVLDELPDAPRLVTLDEDAAGAIPYAALRASTGAPPAPELGSADIATLLYTSGTTGLPKGCMISHGYYGHIAGVFAELMEIGASDTMFSATPLFHATGRAVVFLPAMSQGAQTVIEPEFDAARTVERWIETGATVFMGVGAMGLAMMAQPESPHDREHRLRMSFCSPLTGEQQAALEERYGVPNWSEAYGQTECQPICLFPPRERDRPRGLKIVGRASPYLELRVVDDDDREVATGKAGELLLRPRVPEAMFTGYWGRPEATLETFRGLWHHTGDRVRVDADGVYTFVDRKKDAVRRRGENVSAVELEQAIAAHPSIAEVAVIGIPSPGRDEEIKACIAPAADAAIEPEVLFAFFEETLPYFAVPRYVEVVDALPRNALSRVMKEELRERGVTPDTWDLVAMGLRVRRERRRSASTTSR